MGAGWGRIAVAGRVVELLGLDEAGELDDAGRALLRILTPISKLTTARQSVAVASEMVEKPGRFAVWIVLWQVARYGLALLLRNLAVPEKGQVLDISCGTGYPTVEILRRMSEGSRLIAIDASPENLIVRNWFSSRSRAAA